MFVGSNSGAVSSLHLYSNNTRAVYINRGNIVVGGAVAPAAIDGFLYIPTVPTVKTGVPTAYPGTVPMLYDTNVERLVIFSNGAWKSVGPFL